MSQLQTSVVIFDFDGTLVDSLPGIEFSVKAAFFSCGISVPVVDLRRMIGPPIRTILSRAAQTNDPEAIANLESAFRTSYDSEGWRRTLCYPGTEAALSVLQSAGIRLFIVTNKPRHISLRTLELLRLAHFFECLVTRDSRSPQYGDKREMIEFVLHSSALSAQNCMLVGDTEEDADAAASCKMRFAHVSHGYGTISDGAKSPVHIRLNDFSQLPQLIGLEFAHDR